MDVVGAILLVILVQGYLSYSRMTKGEHRHYDRTAADVNFNRHSQQM